MDHTEQDWNPHLNRPSQQACFSASLPDLLMFTSETTCKMCQVLCVCVRACVCVCKFLKGLLSQPPTQPPTSRATECPTAELGNGKEGGGIRGGGGWLQLWPKTGSTNPDLTSRQGAREPDSKSQLYDPVPFSGLSLLICKMEALTWWSLSALAAAFELPLSLRK